MVVSHCVHAWFEHKAAFGPMADLVKSEIQGRRRQTTLQNRLNVLGQFTDIQQVYSDSQMSSKILKIKIKGNF